MALPIGGIKPKLENDMIILLIIYEQTGSHKNIKTIN